MSSIGISTMGKFDGPDNIDGGGGGGGPIQKRKPVVRVNKVKVDEKKKKYIVVKEIKDYDNIKR